MKKSQFFSLMKLRRLSVASVAGMGAGGGASQAVLLFVEECDWKVIGISRKYFA